MNITDLMPTVIRPIAKAVAVLAVTWLAAGVAWLAAASGADIPFDPTVAETTITSLLLAFVTWATRNDPTP